MMTTSDATNSQIDQTSVDDGTRRAALLRRWAAGDAMSEVDVQDAFALLWDAHLELAMRRAGVSA